MGTTLHEELERWVTHGLLDAQQAEAIERYEQTATATAGAARIPLMTELVVYAGVLLTAVGGAVFAARSWETIGWPGRLVVGLVLAALGLVVGTWLGRIDESGARRLRGVAWLAATGGVGLSAGVLSVWLFDTSPEVTTMVVGAAVTAASLPLWRNLDRPLQLLTAVGGLVAFCVAWANVLDSPPWVGLLGVPVGLGLLALALARRLEPRWLAAAVGAGMALVAVVALNEVSMIATIVLGLSLAAALVVVGVRSGQIAVVVLAALGGWQYLQALVAQYLHGPLGSLLLMLAGLALLVGAVVWLRHRSGGLGRSGPATGAPGAASPA